VKQPEIIGRRCRICEEVIPPGRSHREPTDCIAHLQAKIRFQAKEAKKPEPEPTAIERREQLRTDAVVRLVQGGMPEEIAWLVVDELEYCVMRFLSR
jgi:hypothetical protein